MYIIGKEWVKCWWVGVHNWERVGKVLVGRCTELGYGG